MGRSKQIALDLGATGLEVRREGVVEKVHVLKENGWGVLSVLVDGEAQKWVGTMPLVDVGQKVAGTGAVVDDPKWGTQFKVRTVVAHMPTTTEGLALLIKGWEVPTIGEATAKRIVAAFGDATMDVLLTSPSRVASTVKRITLQAAEALSLKAREKQDEIASMSWMLSKDIPQGIAAKLLRAWGSDAVRILETNPYRMTRIHGVGFRTADRIATEALGRDLTDPGRMEAGVLEAAGEEAAKGGHCLTPRHLLVEIAASHDFLDQLSTGRIDEAVDRLADGGELVLEGDGAHAQVYLARNHEAEVAVAQRILSINENGCAELRLDPLVEFERGNFTLDSSQRTAVALAARNKVVVITGGPGVGKTTVLRALLAVFRGADLRVELAAPTGKAAKRMEEATGSDASTLHRLFGIDPATGRPRHGPGNPIQCDVLCIDESSMVDVALMRKVLDAVSDRTRLVLIGDVDQLPSVAAGAVLHDLIASHALAVARLTTIHRQGEGSAIVLAAHAVNRGIPPLGGDGEFVVHEFPRWSKQDPIRCLLRVVTEDLSGRGFDPIEDVTVLTPMHAGKTGVAELNTILQATLNQNGTELVLGEKTRYRVGDKVMQTKNDYDIEVMNGTIGRVVAVEPSQRSMHVRFDDKTVEIKGELFGHIVLAYAGTVHKFQGSESPAVVMMLLSGHWIMAHRRLVYTGITRGKKQVHLIADPNILKLALSETRKSDRRTGLAQRLRPF